MTGLRLTRRRVLATIGGLGLGAGTFAAVPPRHVTASLRTHEWVLRIRGAKKPRARDIVSLDTAARDAVRAAIEDRYESSDPPAAVRQLFRIDDPTYVRVDDRYYRLDPTLPVYEVWIDPVSRTTAVDPITLDELEQCSHLDPRGYVPPPTARADDRYRTSFLDPELRSCIEEYPYLKLGDDYYRYRTAVDDPGTPYAIEATPVSAQTVADIEGAVVEWTDVPADARDLLLAARRVGDEDDRDEMITRETVPDSLREIDAEYDWVAGDNGFYRVDLDHAGGAPIRIDVAVVDAESREFDPAWLEFSVTNTGDKPVQFTTGPPAPFGILRAEYVGDSNDIGLTLWTREYVENRHIGTRAGRIAGVAAVGLSVTLHPGETRTQRYAVRHNPGRLQPGTYRVEESFGVTVGEDDSDDETTVPFDIEITVD